MPDNIKVILFLFLKMLEIKTVNKTVRIPKEKDKVTMNMFDKPNIIEFVQGDFFKHNWSDATIIFANSTCFSIEMMNNIAEKANKECQSKTIIITFTKKLNKLNKDWEIRDGFRRLMTWGIATIYVHRRK